MSGTQLKHKGSNIFPNATVEDIVRSSDNRTLQSILDELVNEADVISQISQFIALREEVLSNAEWTSLPSVDPGKIYYIKKDIQPPGLENAVEIETIYYGVNASSVNYVQWGLVQHYDTLLNDGSDYDSNAAIWKDLAGSNDGTVQNAIWGQDGLQFNGINSLVEYAGVITPQYTIMGVMQIEHDSNLNTARNPRFTDGTASNYPGLFFRNTATGTDRDFAYSIWAHGKDQVLLNPRTSPPNGQFVHIAYSCDGVSFRLYINGVLVNTLAITVQAASRPLNWLGGSLTTSDRFLKGKICNFMRYNRTLTPVEIVNNFRVDSDKYL